MRLTLFFQFFLSCLLLSLTSISAQDGETLGRSWNFGVDAVMDFSPNGNACGVMLNLDSPVWMNSRGSFGMEMGLQEQFSIRADRGFEGTSGSTIRNGVHVAFGPAFYMLKSRRLFLKSQLYCGWSFKYTNMQIDNGNLGIQQKYTDHYHYLSRGIILRAGYDVDTKLSVSAIFKADLRRLSDFDGILEYPEVLYGLGVGFSL